MLIKIALVDGMLVYNKELSTPKHDLTVKGAMNRCS